MLSALAAVAGLLLLGALALPVSAQAQTCTSDQKDIWCGVVTVGGTEYEDFTEERGYCKEAPNCNCDDEEGYICQTYGNANYGELRGRSFVIDSIKYIVQSVRWEGSEGLVGGRSIFLTLHAPLAAEDVADLTLNVKRSNVNTPIALTLERADNRTTDGPFSFVANYVWSWDQTAPAGGEKVVVWLSEADTPPPGTPSADATLDGLVVTAGSSDLPLTLSPTFTSGITDYTASVDNAVTEVTVRATTSNDNAEIAWLDGSDNPLADANGMEVGQQVTLAVGENVIKVQVTADGSTPQTYTVTVTRREVGMTPPPLDPSDAQWSAELTVGQSSDLSSLGFDADTNDSFGMLTRPTFTVGRTTYTVEALFLGSEGLTFILGSDLETGFALKLDGHSFLPGEALTSSEFNYYVWDAPDLSWSDEDEVAVELYVLNPTLSGVSVSEFRASSADAIVETVNANGRDIHLRYRVQDDPPWLEPASSTRSPRQVMPGTTAVDFSLPNLEDGTAYEVQASLDGTFPAGDIVSATFTFQVPSPPPPRPPVSSSPPRVGTPGGDATQGDDSTAAEPTGYLENPGHNSFQSGIGVISGWVCEAEQVEIEIETERGETERYEAGYGTERADTAVQPDGTPLCGDTDNGFGLLFNWNRLGAGEHAVVAWVDGVELGRAVVTVTTVGEGEEEEFLRGVEGACVVEDFPMLGETVRLEWQQNNQNFVITSGTRPAGTNRAGVTGMGYLENPGPNSFQSGIGVISGWVCEAEGVEIAIETEQGAVLRYEAAYGTERADTAVQRKDGTPLCGDTDNGFGLLFNWNRLGAGEHTVVAYVDDVELGRAVVRVTTVGEGEEEEFLRGAEGECVVADFPTMGEMVTLEWQQSWQNFVITDVQ